MSAFTTLNAAAAAFNETNMGESFTYTTAAGTATSGLYGVFNQAAKEVSLEDFSSRQTVDLVCVSGKPQWSAVVPANGGTITYGSVVYQIHEVSGAASAGEPCYELQLKLLT